MVITANHVEAALLALLDGVDEVNGVTVDAEGVSGAVRVRGVNYTFRYQWGSELRLPYGRVHELSTGRIFDTVPVERTTAEVVAERARRARFGLPTPKPEIEQMQAARNVAHLVNHLVTDLSLVEAESE